MLHFIIRRLLAVFPTLLIIVGIVFFLYQSLPGDPVEAAYVLPLQKNTLEDSIAYQQQYSIYAKELGLDKPLFLFSLTAKEGFQWNGMNNQYVMKIRKICNGDFGNSYQTKGPVLIEISNAIRWTIVLNFITLILIFGFGIILGLASALHYKKALDNNLMTLSFVLDAIPSFWISTMLVVFFTTNYYDMKLFPSIGLGDFPSDLPFWQKLIYAFPHLLLPAFCMTLASISIVIRQMRASSLNIMAQDYVRTGRAKGLNQTQLVKKHILPNAIFPILTLLGMTFPSLIVGSLLTENIFNIPGMGKLSIDAIYTRNFPVLFAIILFIAFFTIIGNLISDILYRVFSPKID
jgi:peptide/nickel transport system permease protein